MKTRVCLKYVLNDCNFTEIIFIFVLLIPNCYKSFIKINMTNDSANHVKILRP